MKLQSSLCALALLSLTACNNDPAQSKVQASVAAPTEQAASAPTTEEEQGELVYAVTSKNSSLQFVGAKLTGKHEGSFADFKGTIHLVGRDPTKSRLSFEIAMNSLKIEPTKLAGHLMSPDFFNVKKYPQATFTSRSLTKSKGKDNYHVIGNLNLHGVEKSISFPATITPHQQNLNVSAEFAINRKDFKIVYPGMPDDLIKDNVLIKIRMNPSRP